MMYEEEIMKMEARIDDLTEEIWLKEDELSDLALNGTEDEIADLEEEISDLKRDLADLEDELKDLPGTLADYADYQHMVAVESRYW